MLWGKKARKTKRKSPVKKNQSWTIAKVVETDFIQYYCNRRKKTSV